MPSWDVEPCDTRGLPRSEVLALYRALAWSSAEKPDAPMRALEGSDAGAVRFYERCGFQRAGTTRPLWIFRGEEHGGAG